MQGWCWSGWIGTRNHTWRVVVQSDDSTQYRINSTLTDARSTEKHAYTWGWSMWHPFLHSASTEIGLSRMRTVYLFTSSWTPSIPCWTPSTSNWAFYKLRQICVGNSKISIKNFILTSSFEDLLPRSCGSKNTNIVFECVWNCYFFIAIKAFFSYYKARKINNFPWEHWETAPFTQELYCYV